MKKRGKVVELNLKIVMPSTCSRFSCRGVWLQGNEGLGKLRYRRHKIKKDTTLTVCSEAYCQNVVCSDHLAGHEEFHLMAKLAGD